ncbi:hypothetical protein Cgig2_021717 [Carnegiea gigantea]|uniref:Uncharacterized protein n=1 Tax=Carnegiea gigantea TaxID=171969 RepID=A0A9Q1GY62_9CARY|nr:hypothetical protein Cgig2_021717 [Carnegiea gigantea]
MTFPRSLSTKEIVEYVARRFEWDRRGAAFPPLPLSKDFQVGCKLPELPQLRGWGSCMGEHSEHWSRPSSSSVGVPMIVVWLYGDLIFEAWFRTKAEPEESSGAEQQEEDSEAEQGGESSATEGVASTFDDDKQGHPSFTEEWYNGRGKKTKNTRYAPFPFHYGGDGRLCEGILHLALEESHTSASSLSRRLPRPMPALLIARGRERAAADFELPEMVHATLYAMFLNEAVELGVVGSFMADGLKSSLMGLRWTCLEAWMSCTDHELREAQLR